MRPSPRRLAQEASARLVHWLVEAAFPIWAEVGFDSATGGFREKIAQDGSSLDLPSRGRVPPRQIFAFSAAPGLGWKGDADRIVRGGLHAYLRDHGRADGLIRPVSAPLAISHAAPVELYDQAFALFGLAAAHPRIEGGLERRARALRLAIRRRLSRPDEGFESAWPPRPSLESNPHMHLLEACLAWTAQSTDAGWRALAEDVVALARDRFIDPQSGCLREFFTADWRAAEGLQGRIVEPGHQFEWAWLLLRWSSQTGDTSLERSALVLIGLAEAHGVDRRGVAIDAILDDLSVHCAAARLWPQTERIKATALAASVTADPAYWAAAAQAVEALEQYFDTPVPGLWHDRLNPDGTFVEEPAPASSLYHIVSAASVLSSLLAN